MIIGSGVDIIEIQRIQKLVGRKPIPTKIYSQSEIQDIQDQELGHKRVVARLAGLFTAKEAVMKALGKGWFQGSHWTEIVVSHTPSGGPVIQLQGKTKELADSLGVKKIFISISHTDTHAIAFAIAEGDEN